MKIYIIMKIWIYTCKYEYENIKYENIFQKQQQQMKYNNPKIWGIEKYNID